ncbi:MAG: hypothetical protein M9921_01055 [Fimbriimonadaceae bacterium]|nr:hypothetical protein [Fimbriimonadaceae bacterium]
MEDDATRPESGGLEPGLDPAERLRQLEAEMQRLKEALGAQEAASAPNPDEPESEEAETEQDPVKLAEAEDLVRRAMVAKRRGQKEEATSLFKAAEAVAPHAPAVLEALGDDLSERGQTKQAIAVYARAIKASPGNIGLERKHANLALRLSGALTVEEQLRSGLSEGAPDSVASAKVAVLLSVLIPGLGQMVTNRVGLGITMLALWIFGWVPALTVTDAAGHRAFSNLPGMLMGRSGADVPVLVLLGVGVAVLVHLSSIAEASMHVPKGTKGRRQPVDRPKPPVDLPFE